MKKRIVTLGLVTVLMLVLIACGQKNTEEPAATTSPTATKAPIATAAPTVTTAPAANETVEPTSTATEAPMVEKDESIEEAVPTEAPTAEEPVAELTHVPVVEEPTPVPDVTNEDDIQPEPEEAHNDDAPGFPMTVTYMHDNGLNRELGWEPETISEIFNTFYSGEEASDDIYFTIYCNYKYCKATYNDIKKLIDVLNGEYIEARCNQNVEILGFSNAEDFMNAVNRYGLLDYRYDKAGNRIPTRTTGEFYVYSLVERSTEKQFVWAVELVLEDVDNPANKTSNTMLYWEYYTTLIDNPAYD